MTNGRWKSVGNNSQAFDDRQSSPDDGDVKTYYDEHVEEFVRPERVRVGIVLLHAPQASPERTAKAAQARKLLARLKVEGPRNPLAFSNIAREASEDAPTKAAGGDTGYHTQDELGQQYSKEIAAAAFALREAGQESNVVETAQGFALVKLLARQAGISRPFAEVKPQLAARVGRERRTKEFDEFVKTLRKSASIKINDGELEEITVAGPAAPAVPAAAQ